MKTLCATCLHDKYPAGCDFACSGVLEFDEEIECVTSCEDYEAGESGWEALRKATQKEK